MKRPSISAFFPAYNDGGTIASMVVSVVATLRDITDEYEVLVINDGSSDHTGEVLAELARVYPELRVITHEKNRGYGGALRSGFNNATKELIFYTDGDAQYDARELKLLLSAFTDSVDLVNGYKVSRSDPINRVILGRLYQFGVKTMFGLRLRDVDCDFRLMRRQIFEKVQLAANSGVICVELMKKVQDAGFAVAEVPVHHYHRVYGSSQFFNFPRVFRTLTALANLWLELVVNKRLARSKERNDGLRVAVTELAAPVEEGNTTNRVAHSGEAPLATSGDRQSERSS
ncbi:MAG: glycosyltransferase family 2 protein [Dehalococcoidia bacterium]|nr:glycosyltransferase family 2 protein [Dehalococcoidia bacterium]